MQIPTNSSLPVSSAAHLSLYFWQRDLQITSCLEYEFLSSKSATQILGCRGFKCLIWRAIIDLSLLDGSCFSNVFYKSSQIAFGLQENFCMPGQMFQSNQRLNFM